MCELILEQSLLFAFFVDFSAASGAGLLRLPSSCSLVLAGR
jgi:hypothetical protein